MGLFSKSPRPVPVWALARIVGDDVLEVHGESSFPDSFRALIGTAGLKAEGGTERIVTGALVQEPHNEYDKNAIVVRAEGHVVGYVPRIEAAKLSKIIAKGGGNVTVRIRVWARLRNREVFGSARVILQ